jgi:hypothetical protein
MPTRQQLTKPESVGGLLLLRRKAPLSRRSVAHFAPALIDLIVPYRSNNKQRRYEDGRKLRRYKRR